jgi:hypothetical protein
MHTAETPDLKISHVNAADSCIVFYSLFISLLSFKKERKVCNITMLYVSVLLYPPLTSDSIGRFSLKLEITEYDLDSVILSRSFSYSKVTTFKLLRWVQELAPVNVRP